MVRADPGRLARRGRRRGRLVVVVVAAVGLACASFLVLRSPPEDPTVPATVLVVGDSHLRGALGDLQAEVVDREAGMAVVSNAFGGLGVKDSPYVGARLGGAREVTHGLDAVVVGLGTNDLIPDQTTTDVAGHLDEILAAAGDVPVLWLSLATTIRNRPGADGFNEELRAAAERHANLSVIDFGAEWDDHPEWFAEDGLHLGADGRAAYAAAVAEALDDQLDDDGGDAA